MKYKNILKVSLAVLLGASVLSGCAQKEWNEITELNLARCLTPGNLVARVDASLGDVVTFDWSLIKDAGGYELVVYTDEAMTQMENSWAARARRGSLHDPPDRGPEVLVHRPGLPGGCRRQQGVRHRVQGLRL